MLIIFYSVIKEIVEGLREDLVTLRAEARALLTAACGELRAWKHDCFEVALNLVTNIV